MLLPSILGRLLAVSKTPHARNNCTHLLLFIPPETVISPFKPASLELAGVISFYLGSSGQHFRQVHIAHASLKSATRLPPLPEH